MPMVRNHLDRFCRELGFHLSEVILKLEDVWVSRRCRWWAILSANFIGQVPLRAFEHSTHPSIPRHVLSSPVVLSLDAIRQLELTGSELEQFLTYEPNLSKLLLRLDVKGPTALHSWGSQVIGCECHLAGRLSFHLRRCRPGACLEFCCPFMMLTLSLIACVSATHTPLKLDF